MAKYFLSNAAVIDLSKIWEYTYEIWSENQADKYYFALLRDCQELAINRNLGKCYEEINKETFGFKSGQHIIFFRIISESEIEIIRFLHARMDLKSRIEG